MSYSDNTKKIIPFTKFLIHSLSPSEKKAAEYLIANPLAVTKMSLSAYARKSESSQASIMRLCHRIGVAGYSELKTNLSIQLALNEQYEVNIDSDTSKSLGSDMIEIIDKVFKVNIQILKDTFALATDEYNRAFEAIKATKKIVFFAIGDAVIPCQFASYKFKRLGYDSFCESDPDHQMINACNLKEGDVSISISHTGNTRLVNRATEIAKENGAVTICITKREKSELTKFSDIKLFTATPDMTVGQEIIARRVAEQAILEALYFGVLQNKEPESLDKINKSSDAMKLNKI